MPPLNLVGDFGGGGMVLAFGMVCALLEARILGRGPGRRRRHGRWERPAGHHVLRDDGPSPVERGAGHQRPRRRCSLLRHLRDRGRKVGGARGRREPILVGLRRSGGPRRPDLPDRGDRSSWPRLRERIAAAIATRTRDEWGELVSGTDTCLTPVLTPREVHDHPHHRLRESFVTVGDTLQPAPAPRFSRTVPNRPTPASAARTDGREVLADWELIDDEPIDHRSRDSSGYRA